MAFAISRNQVLATVLVAGSFLGLASTSAAYAATEPQTAQGKASVDVVAGNRTLDNVAGSETAGNLDFGQVSINDLVNGAVTKNATLQAGAFKVTDNSGYTNGWQLSAAVTHFKAGTENFDGGLTLNGVQLTADDTLKASSVIYTGKQRGTWTSDKTDDETAAKVTVPSAANLGHYTI
ncbi:WxL domain-containing protein [Weissella confusa]|uniref:WxL domain-containing protein n=1 Tax=Weissella confusa TaxID=1583 RepID=UPI00107FB6FA|nr:WxL domain-containing protein [Weissella confusa]TGE79921.1 hypothetical protein C6P10_02900 [Weissella confusa]